MWFIWAVVHLGSRGSVLTRLDRKRPVWTQPPPHSFSAPSPRLHEREAQPPMHLPGGDPSRTERREMPCAGHDTGGSRRAASLRHHHGCVRHGCVASRAPLPSPDDEPTTHTNSTERTHVLARCTTHRVHDQRQRAGRGHASQGAARVRAPPCQPMRTQSSLLRC